MSSRILTFNDWERIQEMEKTQYGQSINEEWSASEILHTIGDVVSVSSDCIWPGSGAVVDIVQAITYFLESSVTKNYTESVSFFIGGIVSLASLALVGPMQILAIESKGLLKVIKAGIKKGATKLEIAAAKTASINLSKFLKGIVSSSSLIASKVIELVSKAAETKLGSWILQKFGTMPGFVNWVNKFFKETVIGTLNKLIGYLGRINPAASAGSIDDVTIQQFGKEYAEGAAKDSTGNRILSSGQQQAKLSGISPSLKYTGRKFGSPEQEFQRDTSGDLKPLIMKTS